MQKVLIIFIVLLQITNQKCIAQSCDTALINALVKDIASMQVTTDGEFYKGTFPSFRECAGAPHNYQPDNNIFYTGVATFALKNMLPYVSKQNELILKNVIAKAVTAYPYYQNKHGYPFYNFWPTNNVIMPHTYYFKYLKGVFAQGEDSDDSVMILMGEDDNDSACTLLKKQLIATSNLSRKKIISTYKKYRGIPAYSTWLGFRMTPDFDFSVHCNILYFMLEKQLPLVKQDTATLNLLQQMIRNREYMKAPAYISPYYVKPSVLLYHLARLMGRFSLPNLQPYKPQIIEDLKQLFRNSNNVLEQVIINTSLMRLGAQPYNISIKNLQQFEQSNQEQFVFFQARAAFPYPTPLKQIFLHFSYINYYFYCPAYYKVLWLEYLVEKEKFLHSSN